MKEQTDANLIIALRKKEPWVVQYFCDNYLPLIRLMVFQNGGSTEEASKVFQQALFTLMEKVADEEFKIHCKLKTYLYCVAENIWKSYLDSKKSKINEKSFELKVQNDDIHFNTAEYQAMLKHEYDKVDLNLTDLEEMLGTYFKTLDKTSRKILSLYWSGISITEIKNALNLEKVDSAQEAIMAAKEELVKRIKKDKWYSRLPETFETSTK